MAVPAFETNIQNAKVIAELFRSACSRFPTGITITTTKGVNGEPHGIYAGSFISVSLHPPLILVWIYHKAEILRSLVLGECFGVNVLSEPQRDLSVHSSENRLDRFAGTSWHPGITGVPLLFGVPAVFECKTVNMIPAGDHMIIIGRVLHVVSAEHASLA
jgi:(E)-2-((N-methylformamido)methylene)succinate hydrolase